MKSLRHAVPFLLALAAPYFLRAQAVISEENRTPDAQNVRVSWLGDLDGGTDDEWAGFQFAYASEIYPLDQMVISYSHTSPDGAAHHGVMLAVEEEYPISEHIVPYGVAGIGYMWTDFDEGVVGDSTGWYGKIGGGLLVKLCEAAGVYAEVTYQASDRDLWLDDDEADSQNIVGMLGVRFYY